MKGVLIDGTSSYPISFYSSVHFSLCSVLFDFIQNAYCLLFLYCIYRSLLKSPVLAAAPDIPPLFFMRIPITIPNAHHLLSCIFVFFFSPIFLSYPAAIGISIYLLSSMKTSIIKYYILISFIYGQFFYLSSTYFTTYTIIYSDVYTELRLSVSL